MRYVVTGGAGYVGNRLVNTLVTRAETEAVAVVDVRRPDRLPPKARLHEADVADQGALRMAVASVAPDAIVHLAFAGAGVREGDAIYQNDVGATNSVLAAAAEMGIGQVVVVSSAAAYGAFPDNPVPLREDCEVRGSSDWHHARVRAVVDRLCQLWAVRHPDRAMTIVRSATVVGPGRDAHAARSWQGAVFGGRGGDRGQTLQFLHVDDLVAALVALLEGVHGGVFNVAGDGTVPRDEGARLAGVRRRLLRRGNADFARYPWLVSTERVRQATGWAPRYSSRGALEAGRA